MHYGKCHMPYAIQPYKVATSEDTFGVRERMLAIREERKDRQGDFAARLNQAAESLGVPTRYTQDMVSKMENGGRTIFIEDVAVLALVDPRRRGKLWLGWGEERDSSLATARRVAEPTPPPVATGFQTKEQRAAKKRRPGDKSA